LGEGGKNLGHFTFRQKILKKFPSIISKISDDLFFSRRQLFYKIDTPFIQNVKMYSVLMFIFFK